MSSILKNPKIVKLQNLLQSDLMANDAHAVLDAEVAANQAAEAMCKLGNIWNYDAFEKNMNLLGVELRSLDIPLASWMTDAEPAPFLYNALKGDIRLVLIAAFAGDPIGYPLLALRRAIQETSQGDRAIPLTADRLLGMIHGFDDQFQKSPKDFTDNLATDVSKVEKVYKPLIEQMFPQLPSKDSEDPGFERNNIDWTTAEHPIIPIPVNLTPGDTI